MKTPCIVRYENYYALDQYYEKCYRKSKYKIFAKQIDAYKFLEEKIKEGSKVEVIKLEE